MLLKDKRVDKVARNTRYAMRWNISAHKLPLLFFKIPYACACSFSTSVNQA